MAKLLQVQVIFSLNKMLAPQKEGYETSQNQTKGTDQKSATLDHLFPSLVRTAKK